MQYTQSTWKSRLGALGPGILMATAAIGGSHLVASTQAGALFGWQLFWLIVVVNVLKYPFFRFGTHPQRVRVRAKRRWSSSACSRLGKSRRTSWDARLRA